MTADISFSPLASDQVSLLLEWFAKPHVNKWFHGEGLENTVKKARLFVEGATEYSGYSLKHWVASLGGHPCGFLMTSLVEGPYDEQDPINKWFRPEKTTMTLDLLIGPEEYLGKGLGVRMIREFLRIHCPEVDVVLIDPDASNTRAVHVYEKAGFVKQEQFTPQHDPAPHWMMRWTS